MAVVSHRYEPLWNPELAQHIARFVGSADAARFAGTAPALSANVNVATMFPVTVNPSQPALRRLVLQQLYRFLRCAVDGSRRMETGLMKVEWQGQIVRRHAFEFVQLSQCCVPLSAMQVVNSMVLEANVTEGQGSGATRRLQNIWGTVTDVLRGCPPRNGERTLVAGHLSQREHCGNSFGITALVHSGSEYAIIEGYFFFGLSCIIRGRIKVCGGLTNMCLQHAVGAAFDASSVWGQASSAWIQLLFGEGLPAGAWQDEWRLSWP